MPILPIYRYLFFIAIDRAKIVCFLLFFPLFSSAKDRGILPHHCLHIIFIIVQSGWIQIEIKKKKKKKLTLSLDSTWLDSMLYVVRNSKIIYNKKQYRAYMKICRKKRERRKLPFILSSSSSSSSSHSYEDIILIHTLYVLLKKSATCMHECIEETTRKEEEEELKTKGNITLANKTARLSFSSQLKTHIDRL